MININRIKKICNKHYYALIVFIFCLAYSCTIWGDFFAFGADESILAIHAVDFGMGFCSKLLPGAIYNIFFDSVGKTETTVYLLVLLTGFFVVLSLILEKFILSIGESNRKTAIIVLAFFLTGPASFAIHIYYPGMLDMYWLFCALLFFILLSSKKLRFLIFLPFVLCITVYFSSLICFIPFFAIIILYEISCTQSKKEKIILWSLLIISVVASIGLSVYFAVYESENLVYSIEEFHEIYSKKGVNDFFYFDQSLYKDFSIIDTNEYSIPSTKADSETEKLISEIFIRISVNLSEVRFKGKIIVFAIISPVVALISGFMVHQLKINIKTKNKFKCFLNICMLLLPLFTIFTSLLFSIDLIRWISHSFITLFASFLFVLLKEGSDSWKWIQNILTKMPFAVLFLYFTFYAATVYDPYYTF